MTDKQISNAIVFPEDRGTGVGGDVDHASAGHFGLHGQNLSDEAYVATGLTFSNIDTTNDTAVVTTGYSFVTLDNVDVQTGSDDTYDTTLPDSIVMTIILASDVSIDLDTDGVNDIYLVHDPTTNDEVYLRFGSSVSAPSDPSVYLGTIDTSDGSTTRPNDGAAMSIESVETSNNVYVGVTEEEAEQLTGLSLSPNNGIQFIGDTGQSIVASASDNNVDGAIYDGWRSRGTVDSPSPANVNDRIAQYRAVSREDDGSWSLSADMRAQVDGKAGTNNEINTATWNIRTRDSNGDIVSGLVVTPNHDIKTPNGSIVHNRLDISSSQSTNGHGYYSVDSSGGAVTLTIVSADAINGRELNVKRRGANTVTIDTEGSETIDGNSSYILDVDNESVTLVYNSNFTDWETY